MKPKCKFLIVDDNEVDQMVTRTLLKKKLAVEDVSQARTGSEALEWLKVSGDSIGDCLIILLDIQMPEMDGFEFLEAYEAVDERVKHKTTIIMLSSTLDPSDIRRATDHKYVKSLFSKPVPTGLLDELMMSDGA